MGKAANVIFRNHHNEVQSMCYVVGYGAKVCQRDQLCFSILCGNCHHHGAVIFPDGME
jgi:putative lipase involved disintegration of autophagic bodies